VVHEEELEQETPTSWPVRASGLGLGTIDHPGLEAAGGGASGARTPVWLLVPTSFRKAEADWVVASAPGAASPALPAAKVNAATAARYFFMADPWIAAREVSQRAAALATAPSCSEGLNILAW
jgi:hypothetical protein